MSRVLLSALSVLAVAATVYSLTISVDNGESDGRWGDVQYCPDGSRAIGFATRNDKRFLDFYDNLALTGVMLFCNDADRTNITSNFEEEGDWGREADCLGSSFIRSFQLRVQPNNAPNVTDYTAVNDIVFRCSNDRDINVIYGNDEGEWGSFSADCPNGVCGIQTRVNPTQAVIDNTAVNNVRFECCA